MIMVLTLTFLAIEGLLRIGLNGYDIEILGFEGLQAFSGNGEHTTQLPRNILVTVQPTKNSMMMLSPTLHNTLQLFDGFAL